MNYWQQLHQWAWWLRWPLKLAVLLVVVVVTLYPKIWLLPRWITRLQDMNAMLEPEHPGLIELEQAARAAGGPDPSSEQMLTVVQDVVCQQIPYAWDWEVWGVMDYLPTTSEVLEKGREDCDGRAVVAAASLLRRMGYQAWLVSDLKHVWVSTPQGDTMGPGAGERTFEADETGTHIKLTAQGLVNIVHGLTYGISRLPAHQRIDHIGGFVWCDNTPTFIRCTPCRRLLATFVWTGITARFTNRILRLGSPSCYGMDRLGYEYRWLATAGD